MKDNGKNNNVSERQEDGSVTYIRCRIAARIIYSVTFLLYLIVTAYFTSGFIVGAVKNGGVPTFTADFLLAFGFSMYGVIAVANITSFIILNVTKPHSGVESLRYAVVGGAALVTQAVFCMIMFLA